RLSPVPDDLRLARLALLGCTGHLHGRELQHGLNAGASHHIDEFVDGHAALLNQFHHGQQRLAVADQKLGKLSLALPLLLNRMVVSFHGGSPFQGFVTPILFRIKGEPPSQLSTTDETPSQRLEKRYDGPFLAPRWPR